MRSTRRDLATATHRRTISTRRFVPTTGKRSLAAVSLRALAGAQRCFAIRECAPLGETLRQPRIVERFQPDGLSPPLVSDLSLQFLFGHWPRRVKHLARQEDHSRTGITV